MTHRPGAGRCVHQEAGADQPGHQEQPPSAGHCVQDDPVHHDVPVPAADRDTQPITLCPTTTGPVARYEDFLLNIDSTETKLISHTGLSQADQLSRAEQYDIEVLESSERIADSKRKKICPGRLEDVETDVEMKQKDRLSFSPRTHEHCSQEMVGVTGNLDRNLKIIFFFI